MSQIGKSAAYAVVTGVAIAVVLDAAPILGTSAPRIFTGALVLAAGALIAFVMAATRWKDNTAIAAAVPSFALGAAAFAIIGLVGGQLVPASDGQPNAAVQAVGLIIVLIVAAVLLVSGSMPTLSWSTLPVITTLVALVLAGAYGAVIMYMLNNAAAESISWDRYMVIFTAVQGVGLAAVGALLGTQAKQGEVDTAKAETVEAKQKTQETVADVLKAVDFADAITAGAVAGRPPTADPATQAAGKLAELKNKYR